MWLLALLLSLTRASEEVHLTTTCQLGLCDGEAFMENGRCGTGGHWINCKCASRNVSVGFGVCTATPFSGGSTGWWIEPSGQKWYYDGVGMPVSGNCVYGALQQGSARDYIQ